MYATLLWAERGERASARACGSVAARSAHCRRQTMPRDKNVKLMLFCSHCLRSCTTFVARLDEPLLLAPNYILLFRFVPSPSRFSRAPFLPTSPLLSAPRSFLSFAPSLRRTSQRPLPETSPTFATLETFLVSSISRHCVSPRSHSFTVLH